MHRCPAEGAGFSSSFLLAMVSSRLLLEPVGHLLPEESGWLSCGYAVGPQASVCRLRHPPGNPGGLGKRWGEAACQPWRSGAGYSAVHCIIFCFSRSSSFLKRDVWQAASPGSRLPCVLRALCSPCDAVSPLNAICVLQGPRQSPARAWGPCTQGKRRFWLHPLSALRILGLSRWFSVHAADETFLTAYS